MSEYIEREELLLRIDFHGTNKFGMLDEDIRDFVKALPAADVVPVVHGRWDDSGRYTFPSGATAVRCTNCGCALTESEYHLNNWNYCPVCGAEMDGGADNAAD